MPRKLTVGFYLQSQKDKMLRELGQLFDQGVTTVQIHVVYDGCGRGEPVQRGIAAFASTDPLDNRPIDDDECHQAFELAFPEEANDDVRLSRPLEVPEQERLLRQSDLASQVGISELQEEGAGGPPNLAESAETEANFGNASNDRDQEVAETEDNAAVDVDESDDINDIDDVDDIDESDDIDDFDDIDESDDIDENADINESAEGDDEPTDFGSLS